MAGYLLKVAAPPTPSYLLEFHQDV